jgi:hypothetical protein
MLHAPHQQNLSASRQKELVCLFSAPAENYQLNFLSLYNKLRVFAAESRKNS